MSAQQETLKISICIATYNQMEYIRDCLLSVLFQSCGADIEILVGDDCSSDGTSDIIVDIVNEFPGRIQYYKHESNIGVCKNYQYLLQQASGDFIAHLDGDDFWLPGKLESQIQFMATHSECVAVYTNAIVINSDRELVGVFTGKHPTLQDINYLLRCGNYLIFSSLLYRSFLKNAIIHINGQFLDYRMHCIFAKQGFLGNIDSALVVYRVNMQGSIQKRYPELQRQLHWDVLVEANKLENKPEALLDGVGNFLIRIFANAVSTKKPGYVLNWFIIVRQEMKYGLTKIFLACIKAGFRKIRRVIQNKLLRMIRRDIPLIIHGR